MSRPPVSLLVSLVRRHPLRWSAEVADAASPVAGLAAEALTRRSARRRVALAAAHELGLCGDLPSQVEVIEWRTETYSLHRR